MLTISRVYHLLSGSTLSVLVNVLKEWALGTCSRIMILLASLKTTECQSSTKLLQEVQQSLRFKIIRNFL